MKKIQKAAEPILLKKYRHKTPDNTWDKFKEKRGRRQQLKQQLISDQGGICAYCEIDLKEANAHGNADYRVEHFHPKSDHSTEHNWHLDWSNLLACCHGGNNRTVVETSTRYTNPDCSCDVPKDSKNLDNLILNPLHIPAFPTVFRFDRSTGKPQVNEDCVDAGIERKKIESTIFELRLDASRLNRLRKPLLDKLNEEVKLSVQSGLSIGDAKDQLARIHLRKDTNGHWPKFFSSIRSYLGNSAEKHLRSIHFNG